MPLHDHFHAPWSELNPWEGFHSAWVNTMVRQLNGVLLPRRYRALPQVHLGSFVEADVATFEQEKFFSAQLPPLAESDRSGVLESWFPTAATQTLEIEFPAQDVFEVRVLDERRGMRLVAVIELVSPGNKDRPEQRHSFVAKCASYLQQQVGVVVIDVITNRHANLHQELQEMFSVSNEDREEPDLYAVSYCNRKLDGKWQLKTWLDPLNVGTAMPTMPLWLSGSLAVPLNLESSYMETCGVLRLP